MLTIKDIKPYKFNVKTHPDNQIDLLAKVVIEIGWRQNVEVNQNGDIVAGHGRFVTWEKYKDDPKMPMIWIMDDMGNTICGEHSKIALTKEQESMWRIADNKLAELASWNLEHFNIEFEPLPIEFKEMTGFNDFTPNTINDVNQEWTGMPEVNKDKIPGAYQSIVIHFEKMDDVKNFADITELSITDNTKYAWFPKREKEDIKSMVFETENVIDM